VEQFLLSPGISSPACLCKAPEAEQERIEIFFVNLQTPVDKEGVGGVQTAVYKLIGSLCLVYGALFYCSSSFPISLPDAWPFLFCGGVMFSVGAILFTKSKRRAEQPTDILSAALE